MLPSHRAIEACIKPTSRLCIELTASPASRHNIERQAFIEPCRVMHRAIDNSQLSRHNIPLPPSPFEWVSNYQVLTAVHLNPLKTKNRTFTLPAGDKKTATEAMEKRREGRQ